jgi:two-component system, NarL family, nitrate/nitrite response regulator NarL
VPSTDQAGTPATIRIVIADDYPPFRDALQRVIDAEPDMAVVAALGDGAAALDEIRRLAPDVAVLDVRMPGLDGIEIALRLVEEQLRARAVVVTLHWNHLLFERAIAAGVSGYLAKETALSDVVDAVRTVARGQTYVAPSLSAGLSGR